MVHVANVERLPRHAWALRLRVAAQAEISISFRQQLRIDAAMRLVAGGAAFAHGLVFERHRARLLAVALSTTLVQARHSEPSFRFEDVSTVWIMALGAGHFVLQHGMSLRQVQFGFHRSMALKTQGGIAPRIQNILPATAPLPHVEAAGSVAGFAASKANTLGRIQPNSSVRTRREIAADVRVTLRTNFISHEAGSLDGLRSQNGRRHCRAGVENRGRNNP